MERRILQIGTMLDYQAMARRRAVKAKCARLCRAVGRRDLAREMIKSGRLMRAAMELLAKRELA